MAKHKNYQKWIPPIVIVTIVAAVGIGISVAVQPFDDPYSCTHTGQQYTMTVRDSQSQPANVDAQRCDTLTIANKDTTSHVIMFGHHDHMTPYDGITQQQLSPGNSLTISLGQTGSFHFHIDGEDAIGTFSVR